MDCDTLRDSETCDQNGGQDQVSQIKICNSTQIRVAAYIRCITGKDPMLHNLVNKINSYTEIIQKTPRWTFAGIYADNSGRSEYQRLISDCEGGLIDLILVQSISTFGLKPIPLAELVEKLAGQGIGIIFENEGIDTVASAFASSSNDIQNSKGHPILSEDGSTMLSIFNSLSKRDDKTEHRPDSKIYGFDDMGNPVESEANVIRTIFDLFLMGFGRSPIASILNDEYNPPPNRKSAWTYVDIKRILSERAYSGSIIEEETFLKASKENQRRTVAYGYRPPTDSLLARKITCGICGDTFTRRDRRNSSIWLCRTYLKKGKSVCQSRCIREKVLLSLINTLTESLERLDNITVYPDGRLVITVDDVDYEKVWRDDNSHRKTASLE